jgi:hypothetical protein
MSYGKTTEPFELDEMTKYVLHNYSPLLTLTEHLAWKTYVIEAKADYASSEDHRRSLRRKFGTSGANAVALLESGPEHFFVSVRDRELREHKDKVVLNKCPVCDALCRTPEAKLYPKCNHCWRQSANKSENSN